jgi:hypothetical protein
MKNINKGFIIPAMIVIVLILTLGGGAYVYLESKKVDKVEINNEEGVVISTSTIPTDNTNTATISQESYTLATSAEINSGDKIKPATTTVKYIEKKELILNHKYPIQTPVKIEKDTTIEYNFLLTSSEESGDYGLSINWADGENLSIEIIDPFGKKIDLTKEKIFDDKIDKPNLNPIFHAHKDGKYSLIYKIKGTQIGKWKLTVYNSGSQVNDFYISLDGGSNIHFVPSEKNLLVKSGKDSSIQAALFENTSKGPKSLQDTKVVAYIYNMDDNYMPTVLQKTISVKNQLNAVGPFYENGEVLDSKTFPFLFRSEPIIGLKPGKYVAYFIIKGKDSSGYSFHQGLPYMERLFVTVE